MKTLHTSAPWQILRDHHTYQHNYYYTISAGHGCHTNEKSGFTLTAVMSEANANLIAAAPDMLEALTPLLPLIEEYRNRKGLREVAIWADENTDTIFNNIIAAVNKAKGGAH